MRTRFGGGIIWSRWYKKKEKKRKKERQDQVAAEDEEWLLPDMTKRETDAFERRRERRTVRHSFNEGWHNEDDRGVINRDNENIENKNYFIYLLYY